MSRKKRHKAHANHERWLVSYADFITLLFAFFVVLYASSQADKKKAAQVVAASIKGAFQTAGCVHRLGDRRCWHSRKPREYLAPSSWMHHSRWLRSPALQKEVLGRDGFGVDVDELRRQLESALGDEIRQHEVQMRVTPEGLVVSLREVGFFNSGQAELLENGHSDLDSHRDHSGWTGF